MPAPRPAAEAVARAAVVHALPGRVRLRFAMRRGDAAWFEVLADRLRAYPEVTAVTISPASAGVLVHHLGSLAQLTAEAERNGLFLVERLEVEPPDTVGELRGKVAAFGRWMDMTTGDGGVVPAVVFVMLVVGGVAQLARGNVLAPAVTLFWYAATLALAARTARGIKDGRG